MDNIVSGFGLLLKRIEDKDLELVRFWRNSEYVKQFMVFKQYISPEMQFDWFNQINNDFNYYFIIFSKNTPVGLVNIKNIDSQNKMGESGIFLSSPEFVNSDLGVRAIILLLDFAFTELGLLKLHQTISTSNRAALNFNKHLGVELIETTNGICKGTLLKNNYFKKTKKIREILIKQSWI